MATTRTRVEQALARTPVRRVRFRLGGSHTVVTYPPLDALDPLEEGAGEPFSIAPPLGPLHYYLHSPACEHLCSFCHYTTILYDRGRSALDAYFDALEQEIEERARQTAGSFGGTVYCGGGTPTALDLMQLARLASMAGRLAGRSEARICFEASPITLAAEDGREKLNLLCDAGVHRFSVGIQTFDANILPAVRRHDLGTALTALDRLKATGRLLNIDLIQDLEGQTLASLANDLSFVARYRPEQVTWYILRLHAPSALSKRARTKGVSLVDDVESALRRAFIIEEMAKLGYRRCPGGRFTLGDEGDQYKAVRGGVDSHLLGLGVSSYSHGWGWFFRNTTDNNPRLAISDYVARIRSGRTPVRWATPITPEERTAGQLCQLAREHIPPGLLDRDDRVALEARGTLARLVRGGLMAGNERQGYWLTEIGWLFEEEIASLFYSPRVRRRLKVADAYWNAGSAQPRPSPTRAVAAKG